MRSTSASASAGGSIPTRSSARRSIAPRRYHSCSWLRAMPNSQAARSSSQPARQLEREAIATANVSATRSTAASASRVRRLKKVTIARAWLR
jgi:hypothetical protein